MRRQKSEMMSGMSEEQFSEKSVEDSDLKASIMNLISADSKVLSSEIAKQLSVSQRTVERHIKQLREDGQIIRHGTGDIL